MYHSYPIFFYKGLIDWLMSPKFFWICISKNFCLLFEFEFRNIFGYWYKILLNSIVRIRISKNYRTLINDLSLLYYSNSNLKEFSYDYTWSFYTLFFEFEFWRIFEHWHMTSPLDCSNLNFGEMSNTAIWSLSTVRADHVLKGSAITMIL